MLQSFICWDFFLFDFWENNSYISSYDDGDTFGYDIPQAMEAKMEGMMKLDWDKDSSSPDVTPYVKMISQLTAAAAPRLAKMNPKLASSMQGMMKSCMAGSTAEVSSLVIPFQFCFSRIPFSSHPD